MKFTISINQIAMSENFPTLGLKHAVIIDYIKDFANTGEMKIKTYNKIPYYWVEYDYLLDNMPLLKLQKDRLYRHIKDLCDLSILIAHPDNQRSGEAYFAFGKSYKLLVQQQKPTVEKPKTYGEKTEGGTVKKPKGVRYKNRTNKDIKDKDIKDNTIPLTPNPQNSEPVEDEKPNKKEFSAPPPKSSNEYRLINEASELTQVVENILTENSQQFTDIHGTEGFKKDYIKKYASKYANHFFTKYEICSLSDKKILSEFLGYSSSIFSTVNREVADNKYAELKLNGFKEPVKHETRTQPTNTETVLSDEQKKLILKKTWELMTDGAKSLVSNFDNLINYITVSPDNYKKFDDRAKDFRDVIYSYKEAKNILKSNHLIPQNI